MSALPRKRTIGNHLGKQDIVAKAKAVNSTIAIFQ
jgi:hypothetical protein